MKIDSYFRLVALACRPRRSVVDAQTRVRSAPNRFAPISNHGCAAVVLLLLAGLALAAGDDIHPVVATTPTPTSTPARPMSEAYNVLLVRSIFSRDHNRAAPLASARNAAPAVPTTQDTRDLPDLTSPLAEMNYVLKGVAVQDGVKPLTAGLEWSWMEV